MTCNKELEAAGSMYPRTCKRCGLGPCLKTLVVITEKTRTAQICDLLHAMTYGEFCTFADSLRETIEGNTLTGEEKWRSGLHYFAETGGQ